MDSPTQVAIGVGLGYLASRFVFPGEERLVSNRSRRRKKKFVRVRGHMRCMPKKCKEPKPAAEPTWSRPQRQPAPTLEVPERVELSANEFGDDEPTRPAIPSTLIQSRRSSDWPTMADVMTTPRPYETVSTTSDAIPWKTIIIVGAIASGLAIVGAYAHQQQAQHASEVTP